MKLIGRIPHRAELLTVRLITGLIAVEALFEIFAVLPFHLSGESRLEPYRVVTSVLAGMGIPIMGGFLALRGSLRLLKGINGATAVGHIMILTGWLVLVPESNRSLNTETLWILASGPAIAAAIIAWGLGWGWIVFALTAIGFPIIDYLSSAAFTSPDGVLDSLKALVFSLGVAAAVAALLNAAKELDIQAEESHLVAEELAISKANTNTRNETNLLIHDDILSTLTFAAGNEPEVRAVVAQQARKALARIDELTWAEQSNQDVTAEEFTSHVNTLVTELGSPVEVLFKVHPEFSLPQDAETALLGALAQALANSIEHAGKSDPAAEPLSRTLHVSSDASCVEVVIKDSGQGFILSAVPAHRLGIRKSIVGRMNSIDGGEALVESQLGVGTTIVLRWNSKFPKVAQPAAQQAHSSEFGYGRLGIFVIALVYIACHLLMAGIRLSMGATPLPSLGALIALCVAMGLIAKNGSKSLSPPSAAGIIGLTLCAALMQFLEPASQVEPRLLFWYLPGIAAILVLLVLNNYVALAWSAMGVVLVISLLAAGRSGQLSSDYILVIFRPVLMLGAGTLFLLPMNYFQRRLVQLREEEAEVLAQTVFEKTAREQRYKNAVFLKNQAGTILQLLTQGKVLSDRQIMDCIALEGRLRDRSRGQRLTQSPLSTATANARKRGIEVVLLDDAGINITLEKNLDFILTWMSHQLDSTTEGKFTGRIVPEGRAELATIVLESSGNHERLLLFTENEAISPPTLHEK